MKETEELFKSLIHIVKDRKNEVLSTIDKHNEE